MSIEHNPFRSNSDLCVYACTSIYAHLECNQFISNFYHLQRLKETHRDSMKLTETQRFIEILHANFVVLMDFKGF